MNELPKESYWLVSVEYRDGRSARVAVESFTDIEDGKILRGYLVEATVDGLVCDRSMWHIQIPRSAIRSILVPINPIELPTIYTNDDG